MPAVAEADVALRRKNNNFKTTLVVASSFLSFSLMQYYSLSRANPEFERTAGLANILLIPLISIPRLFLGAECLLKEYPKKLLVPAAKDSFGFTRPKNSFYHNIHRLLVPLMFAFISFLDKNPLPVIAASLLYYLVDSYAFKDEEPTWTPTQFKLPSRQFRRDNPDDEKIIERQMERFEFKANS